MALIDEIVSRYLQAATLLAETPDEPQPEGTIAAQGGRLSPPEYISARGLAAQQLLTRQARLLVQIHTSWLHVDNGESAAAGDEQEEAAARPDESFLRARLDDIAEICMSAFYSHRFDLVPYHWRQIYTDTLILQSHLDMLREPPHQALRDQRALGLVVAHLDRALITAGGAGRVLGKRWIEGTLDMLDRVYRKMFAPRSIPLSSAQKIFFPKDEPHGRPRIAPEHACPRHQGWGIAEFEDYVHAGERDPRPVVFEDLMADWPALGERPWRRIGYLMDQTLGGKRLVPVELGRSYVDDGWGQELLPFQTFLERYVLPPTAAGGSRCPSAAKEEGEQAAMDGGGGGGGGGERTGYLAQHDLFMQIPALRRDVLVPDLCWASVPGHPLDEAKNQPALDDAPRMNAWFGPARTITPLHTDGYYNLLCQVVGTKYVRLYPPGAGERLRPRGTEHGVDMGNTSELDVGVLEGWDPVPLGEGDDCAAAGDEADAREEALRRMRESLRGVEYWECVLGPGDALLIPIGWWHYVRSLSISFSVSFWWN